MKRHEAGILLVCALAVLGVVITGMILGAGLVLAVLS